MIEKEYKLMITKEAFNRLLENYDMDNPIVQKNYYFIDQDGLLRLNHITVRVREYLNENFLQIKFGKHSNSADGKSSCLAIREEYSRKINSCDDVNIDEIKDVTGIKINDIHCVGFMKTLRYKYLLRDDIILCLDKNKYLNHIDYEMEIELCDLKNFNLNDLLEKLQIIALPKSGKGKCTRFLHRLQVIKNDR